MRALIAFLLLAAAAVTLALLFRLNTGYVLFVAPPYRVELSHNAFIIIARRRRSRRCTRCCAPRCGSRSCPREVREGRRRRQLERFRAASRMPPSSRCSRAVTARRDSSREEALAIPQSSPVAALVGARAALETRDYAGASSMLDRPDTHATNLAVPRLMLEAEIALERGQPAEALARLAELRREAGLHTAAQRLELRALTAAGRPGEIPALVDQLVKRKVYDPEQGDLLRGERARGSAREPRRTMRRACAPTGRACRRTTGCSRKWRAPPRASFLQLGGDREAAEILAQEPRQELGLEL